MDSDEPKSHYFLCWVVLVYSKQHENFYSTIIISVQQQRHHVDDYCIQRPLEL